MHATLSRLFKRRDAQGRRATKRRRLFLEPLELRRVLAPLVTGLDPVAGSHEASISAGIAATFTESLNPSTVNDQTLVIHGLQSGRLRTNRNDSFSAAGPTARVEPNRPFFPGEQVMATATAGIQNGTGDAATPHTWWFRAGVLTGSGIFDDSGQGLGNAFGQEVDLGDLDGDGDLDAFVVNAFVGNIANRVWINQGGAQGGTAGTFAANGQMLGNSHSTGIELGDLDGDGDLDAFVTNSNNQGNRVWMNQGGAQGGTAGTFSDNGQSLGNYGSQDLSLGDVDGDGDLDAFVANIHPAPQSNSQGETVWLNQGGIQGGTAGLFSDSGQRLGSFASADVSLGDVDGDGDLDAFVGTILGDGDRVWLNQGGLQGGTMGIFSDSGQTLGYLPSEGVALGDLDNDGDLDAFTATAVDFVQANRVWINQGGAQSGTAGIFVDSNQGLGTFRSKDVDLGDVDGDGDLDAFIANSSTEANRIWINQGGFQGGLAGTFLDSGQALGTTYSLGVSLGDVDGDGDLDAFEANFSGQANGIWLNRNLDLGDAPESFGTTSARNGARHIPVGPTLGAERDIEPDGVPTVDASGDDASNTGSTDDEDGVVFAASSVGQLDSTVTVSVAGGAARLDAWVDLDHDGSFDAVGERVAHSLPVVVGSNLVPFDVPAHAVSGQPLAARFRLSTGGGLGPRGAAANGEVEDHVLVLDAPAGSGSFGDSELDLGASASTNVSLGDVDGDGDLDAYVANFGGQPNRLWHNLGGVQGGAVGSFSDSGQLLGASSSGEVSLGDVDGDGDLDAFVANYNQPNRVWINLGAAQGGTPGTFSDSGQSLGSFASLAASLADVDGDGDLDAVVANVNQPNRVWLNQGGVQGGQLGQFADSNQALGTLHSLDVSLGDLDRDGDLDAFIANLAQENRVWLNQGGRQSGTAGVFSDSGQSLGTRNSTGVALGDFDADGDLDALVTNRAQGNRVWINLGGAQGGVLGVFADSGQTMGSGESYGVDLADFDGDGDLDAFISNRNQPNRVWLNLGGAQGGSPGTFAASPQELGAFGSLEAGVGDVDNDGDLDAWVANFANQGNRVWLNQPAATPRVLGNFVNGAGIKNRSRILSLTFEFDLPVNVPSAGGLKLFNHTTGAAVDVSAAPLQGNGTTAVTWDLAGLSLPDGYYSAKLPRTAATSLQGQQLAATQTGWFHALAGDSTGDGAVGFADFGDLATNFNTVGGPLLGPGDLNGDGDVTFADFGILAGNFNAQLVSPEFDFGDALEAGTSFPTTLPAGARHVLGSGLVLGTAIDGESNGQPGPLADGDGIDEDGVAFAALQAGTSAGVTVTASVPGTAFLNAWLDLNSDGDWDDPGEQIFVDQPLNHGVNSLVVVIPANAAPGPAFARFRITSCAGHAYSGLAPDGEVEDYLVNILAAVSRNEAGLRFSSSVRLETDVLSDDWREAALSESALWKRIAADASAGNSEYFAMATADRVLATPPALRVPAETETETDLIDQAFGDEVASLLAGDWR